MKGLGLWSDVNSVAPMIDGKGIKTELETVSKANQTAKGLPKLYLPQPPGSLLESFLKAF